MMPKGGTFPRKLTVRLLGVCRLFSTVKIGSTTHGESSWTKAGRSSTVIPFTERITSPGPSPIFSAGEPGCTAKTITPESVWKTGGASVPPSALSISQARGRREKTALRQWPGSGTGQLKASPSRIRLNMERYKALRRAFVCGRSAVARITVPQSSHNRKEHVDHRLAFAHLRARRKQGPPIWHSHHVQI